MWITIFFLIGVANAALVKPQVEANERYVVDHVQRIVRPALINGKCGNFRSISTVKFSDKFASFKVKFLALVVCSMSQLTSKKQQSKLLKSTGSLNAWTTSEMI